MRFKTSLCFLLSVLFLLTGTESIAQRNKGNKYNKGKRNAFESRMNRKKTGMLNSPYRSKRSKRMGHNKVKKKKTQYNRSDYYTSRARGKNARAKSFNYRARGTRHNASNPFKSGRKKFGYTQNSPFKAKKRKNFKGSGNKGTKAKGRKRKTDKGMGRAYRYNKKRQPGVRSNKNFISRKNRRKASRRPDYNRTEKKFQYNKKRKGNSGNKRALRKAKRRGGKAKPDFSYNKRRYDKNKRKNMKKSTRKRLNPRG
ncbi:MAG: hypothetical protein ACHQF2_03635 [Flavobacteriales bacterium]